MTTKKGPLSKVEREYIDANYMEKTAEEIASDLNRSLPFVTKHIPERTQNESTSTNIKAGDFFARNEDRGATIMTKTASQVADENRKNVNPLSSSKYNNAVAPIRKQD